MGRAGGDPGPEQRARQVQTARACRERLCLGIRSQVGVTRLSLRGVASGRQESERQAWSCRPGEGAEISSQCQQSAKAEWAGRSLGIQALQPTQVRDARGRHTAGGGRQTCSPGEGFRPDTRNSELLIRDVRKRGLFTAAWPPQPQSQSGLNQIMKEMSPLTRIPGAGHCQTRRYCLR